MLADHLKNFMRTRSPLRMFTQHGQVYIRSRLGPGWINGEHAVFAARYLSRYLFGRR